MSIEIKNLNFVYGKNSPFETYALKDININIEKGDFFGIIGHTGSGKSTLIQHLNGLVAPQTGSVVVAGIDVSDKKQLKTLRKKCGMVFQYPEYQLFGETVFEDVAFGLINFYGKKKTQVERDKKQDKANKIAKKGNTAEIDFSDLSLTPTEIEARVKAALELVGLNYLDIKDKSPFQISGGQKRRVAIAGIIVTEPEILVLDEPTAGLDPHGKQEILQLINDLKSTCCDTIVMISHDMDEIAENCNKVAVLSKGEVVTVSKVEELFTNAELLLGHNLDLPIIAKMVYELAKVGINVEYSKDYKAFAKSLSKTLRGEKLSEVKL